MIDALSTFDPLSHLSTFPQLVITWTYTTFGFFAIPRFWGKKFNLPEESFIELDYFLLQS